MTRAEALTRCKSDPHLSIRIYDKVGRLVGQWRADVLQQMVDSGLKDDPSHRYEVDASHPGDAIEFIGRSANGKN
jgi:hypothetical protein